MLKDMLKEQKERDALLKVKDTHGKTTTRESLQRLGHPKGNSQPSVWNLVGG